MKYKMRGKVLDTKKETIENKKGGEPYEKMFVTIEEGQTDFTHIHQFELFGKDAIELQENNAIVGNFVTIEFYIKSNQWKDKFFNSLNIVNIITENETKLNEDLPF
jgi:hypothetical protein